MARRAILHQTLINLFASMKWVWNPDNYKPGMIGEPDDNDLEQANDHIYFQPPESIKMHYPCIVYELSGADSIYADDRPYIMHKKYQLTVIDKNPDSMIPNVIGETMPTCKMSRAYTADNLNHTVFTIYY